MPSATAIAKRRTRAVHPHVLGARDAGETAREEEPDPESGENDAEEPARHREDEALRQELEEQPPAVRAERGPDRDLASPDLGPREEEVGHVGAGDEQQEHHGAGEEEERGAHASRDLVGERYGEGREAHGLGVEPFLGEAAGHRLELGRGLRGRRSRRELRRRVEAVIAALLGGVEEERHPELRRLRGVLAEVRGKTEAAGHDADHLAGPAVDQDRPAHEPGVAPVAALPEPVADDHHRVRARLLLFRSEVPAEDRIRAQGREGVDGDGGDAHAHRVPVPREVGLVGGPRRHLAEGGQAPVVEHLVLADPRLVEAGPAAPDHDAGVRSVVGEGPDEHRVHHAEEGGGRADAESERERAGDGQAGRPEKGPRSSDRIRQQGGDEVHQDPFDP